LKEKRKMATEETISATKAQRELEAQAKKINKYRINLIGMEEKLEIAAAKLRESNAEKEQLISQLQQARHVHSQALQQELEENSNMATEEAVSATKAQSKEIKHHQKTINCLEENLQIASRKLLESNADRVRLKYHLNHLMDQMQQSNIVERSLTVEGQVENLKQKLVEKEDLHKKLKAQVLNLKNEVECWRSQANTIRLALMK
jgi:predicted RNase H-like nuclease (RuvC/YqgF family)